MEYKIETPITYEKIKNLKIKDLVYLTGTIYTLRDAGHKKLLNLIEEGKKSPVDFSGQVVYYAGPCPNRPEFVIGSIGPTTSYRMDSYSPKLMEKADLKIMIGKGKRNEEVVQSIKKHKGIYFIAVGGAGALISKCVKSVETVAFKELGTESLKRLYVEDLPLIVGIDINGKNIYS